MISKEIKQTLLLAWPLFLGLSMIMVGNGLQGTFLGLRASYEGFPVVATGIIMSLYYAGFLVGCKLTPGMIGSVGHIRVFAAFASIASTTILLHGVFLNPWVWGIVRLFTGISFAGLFIVTESWLNSISTNRLRGQVFGIYLLVLHGSVFIGQYLLVLAPLESIDLFILISILLTLSVLPLVLADKPAPGYAAPEKLPLKELFKSSQLPLFSVFASGFCSGTILGIGAVYASELGKSTTWTASFLACYILGSALLPLLIGSFSDKYDRRKVLIVISMISALTSLALHIDILRFPAMFVFGGMNTSIYSVGLAYMNDKVRPEQSVSASTSLILLNGIGAMLGPLISGALMDYIALDAFFYGFTACLLALFAFGLYRAKVGEKNIVQDQGEFIPVPAAASGSPVILQIIEGDNNTEKNSSEHPH